MRTELRQGRLERSDKSRETGCHQCDEGSPAEPVRSAACGAAARPLHHTQSTFSTFLGLAGHVVGLPGALYLGIIALIPLIALATVGANQNFPFGGASILIIVGVGLETVKQIDSQLQQRHYEGLLR